MSPQFYGSGTEFPTGATVFSRYYRTDLGALYEATDRGGWGVVTPLPCNVKEFGARGDGRSDDSSGFRAAQVALQGWGGGTLEIPEGSYLVSGVGLLNRCDKMTWRGAGMYLSRISRLNTGPLFQVSSGAAYTGKGMQTFEDLWFDLNGVATAGAIIFGLHSPSVTFRRCRFTGLQAGSGISLSGVSGAVIEDCVFENEGIPGTGSGIFISNGARDIRIRRCRFLYLYNGVLADTGGGGANEEVAEDIDVSDGYFDAGWWLIKSRFAGSGGTVAYTGTVLTDTAAAFSGIAVGTTCRVMPVRATGTCTAATDNQELTDTAASFTGDGILRGEIIRSGTKWATVVDVESDTKIRIEQWQDATTYRQTGAPAAGEAYTVYGVYLGRATTSNATSFTTLRWHDMTGATVTPTAGDLYEVLYSHPNYPVQFEGGSRNIRVTRNTIRRGWSDQVSIHGTKAIIVENIIEDGQDEGITLSGERSIVANNRITHQGASAIYATATDSVISNNVLESSPWQNFVAASLGVIDIPGSSRCLIQGNIIDGLDLPFAKFGITLAAPEWAPVSDGNVLALNMIRGVSTFGIHTYGANVTNTKLVENVGTVGSTP